MNQVNKRFRWATQRHPNGRPEKGSWKKRVSTLSSLSRHSPDSSSDLESEAHRRVYVNIPLPDSEKDEDGVPLQSFPRNKVRTSRYTPLSFIPKNLFYQFHNVANVYFLILIILQFFSIFGASNPALGAVPLIVIVVITAVKDAIEDWRRTILDMELNSTPTHLLTHFDNVNIGKEHISYWRQLKKASSRLLRLLLTKARKRKDDDVDARDAADLARVSTAYSEDARPNAIRMHDVSSTTMEEVLKEDPFIDNFRFSFDLSKQHMSEAAGPGNTSFPVETGGSEKVSKHGSVLDPSLQPSGKAKFKRTYWKDVRVGDFVRLSNDDPIPADVIILATSENDGACYVETKNLDGETNLKVRHALRAGMDIHRPSDCERAVFYVESEMPHVNLYSYSAVVRWNQVNPNDSNAQTKPMAEAVGINNLLLRGCNLRNTEWVIGVVAFTGRETKIMMNAGMTPSKRSRIARDLNWNVLVNFVFIFIMCFVGGIVQGVTWRSETESLQFFEFGSIGGSPPVDGLITFWYVPFISTS